MSLAFAIRRRRRRNSVFSARSVASSRARARFTAFSTSMCFARSAGGCAQLSSSATCHVITVPARTSKVETMSPQSTQRRRRSIAWTSHSARCATSCAGRPQVGQSSTLGAVGDACGIRLVPTAVRDRAVRVHAGFAELADRHRSVRAPRHHAQNRLHRRHQRLLDLFARRELFGRPGMVLEAVLDILERHFRARADGGVTFSAGHDRSLSTRLASRQSTARTLQHNEAMACDLCGAELGSTDDCPGCAAHRRARAPTPPPGRERRNLDRQHQIRGGARAMDPPLTTRACADWMGFTTEWVRGAIDEGVSIRGRMVKLDAETLTINGRRTHRIHLDRFREFLCAIGWARIPPLPRSFITRPVDTSSA